MILVETILDVADNSGAKSVKCIKILGGTRARTAKIGDMIVVAIQEAMPKGKVKKGDIHRGVVVRTKKEFKRKDGSTVKFDTNAIVLVNKDKEPVGTRIFGPVTRELRGKGYMKIVSLAPEVL